MTTSGAEAIPATKMYRVRPLSTKNISRVWHYSRVLSNRSTKRFVIEEWSRTGCGFTTSLPNREDPFVECDAAIGWGPEMGDDVFTSIDFQGRWTAKEKAAIQKLVDEDGQSEERDNSDYEWSRWGLEEIGWHLDADPVRVYAPFSVDLVGEAYQSILQADVLKSA